MSLDHSANHKPRWSPGLTMAQITEAFAEEHRVSVRELKSDCKRWYISRPRQALMHRLYATGRWSLPQIGRFFGRDHTTVLHGIRAHEARQAA
jgi:chromosomal replication initiator protein